MRERLQRHVPWLRKLAPIWKALDVADTVAGTWERIPSLVRHAMTFALSWLVFTLGTAIVAWLRDVGREHWPVVVVLGFGIGLGTWGLIEVLITERMRRAMSGVTRTVVKTATARARIAEPPRPDRTEAAKPRVAVPVLKLSDPKQYRETFYPTGTPSVQRPGTLYRVLATNVGEVVAEGVQVKITHAEPQIRQGLFTVLHQTDDNRDGFLQTFTLPPGEDAGQQIDVVLSYDDEPGVMHIYHAVPGITWDGSLSGRNCRMTITISAATPGAVSYSRTYEAWIDDENRLQVKGAG